MQWRWWVIGASAAVLIGLGFLAVTVSRGTVNSFDIPGAESQRAFDLLRSAFPERAGDYGDVVFRAEGGVDEPATRARMEELLTAVADVPQVTSVTSPYDVPALVSADGRTAVARVAFSAEATDVRRDNVRAIEQLVDEARADGRQVEFGGPVPFTQEREGPNESTLIGLVSALVILFVLFRRIVPAILPLVSAVIGLAGGFALIFSLTAVVDLGTFVPNIAAMLGLGVGIDYALFIVARHRENLRIGHTPGEAAGIAITTAGRAVLFAGGIVMVSLLGLALMGIPFVGWLGVAAALMVGFSIAVALVFLPAALGLFGTLVGRARPVRTEDEGAIPHESGIWYRLGYAIMRRPYLFLAVSAVTLLVLAYPVLDMRLGSSDAGDGPTSHSTRRAYDLMAEAFGPGMNGPLLVVVDGASATAAAAVADELRGEPGVASVGPPSGNAAGDVALITVIPTTAPQSPETADLIHRIRDRSYDALPEGGEVLVTGTTAKFTDIAERISERLALFFGIVIGTSFILLMVIFRSILIPLKAALMNLLSIGAAYGVVVAVFQWGWGLELVGGSKAGPIESFLPMMLFAVVFGLSMDYEVFLVSRMREEYLRTGDNALSVARGLSATAAVITAAASIMIVVFLSFVLNDQRVVKEFGLGLAVAVLVDATIVRLVLVPSTMELMGRWNWWLPAWLDRLLPRASIEEAHASSASDGSRRTTAG